MVLEINPESVEGMKVAELKDALGARNLSTKGVKKELAARLLEAIQQGDSTAGEPSVPESAAAAQHPAEASDPALERAELGASAS